MDDVLRGFKAKIENQREFNKKKDGWLHVNLFSFLGVIGASFCFSWIFSILLIPDFTYSGSLDKDFLRLGKFVFVAVAFVVYLIAHRAGSRLQRHRKVLFAISFFCGVLSLVPYFDAVPVCQLVVKAAFAGISMAFLLLLWAEFLCAHLKEKIRFGLALSLALSFSLIVGVLAADVIFTRFLVLTHLLVSLALYFFLYCTVSMDSMPFIDPAESDSRVKISWRSFLLTAMASVAQGFALYSLLDYGWDSLATIFFWVGILIISALLLLDSLGFLFIKELLVRRLFLPVVAACVLTLTFLPEDLRIIPCSVAFCFSLLPYASALFATCEHVVRSDLSAIRAFAWARQPAALGTLLGLLIGWAAFSSNLFGRATLLVFTSALIIMFFIAFSMVAFKSFYPDENDPRVTVFVWADKGKGDVLDGDDTVKEVAEPKEISRDYLREKCEKLAKMHELTDRQAEVLLFLAKGRSISYIQKQLFISQHTAKAHVCNVYKKLGIHSKQDVIDLIDNLELER